MLARHAHYANVARTILVVTEISMRCRRMPRALLATTLLLVVLGGCDTTTYKNSSHPGYGDAEYKNDLAQCRKQNSKVVIRGGYDDKSVVEVDEDKARSCMNEHGWQAVSR
jgi:hypothetical protein